MSIDRELKIHVKTTSDVSGVQDVVSETKNLAKSVGETTDKTKEGTEAEEGANSSRRESRELIRSIGEISPEVAEITRVAFLGVAGAIGLMSKLLGEAQDQIKELGESSTPEFETLTDAVEEQKRALEEVDIAAESYDRTLDRIASSMQSVQEAAAAFNSILEAQATAQETLLGKQHARDEQMIDSMEKAGVMAHAQAITAKLALDEQYAAKRIALENKQQAQAVEEKTRERANQYIEAEKLETELAAKRAAARAAAGKDSLAGKRQTKDEGDLAKTEDKIKQLEEQHLDLQGFHPFKWETLLQQQRKQNDTQLQNERETATKLRQQIAHDDERGYNAKRGKKTADDDLTDLEARLKAAVERIKQLDNELPSDVQKMHIGIDARNQGGVLDSQTRELRAVGELGGQAHRASTDALQGVQGLLRTIIQGHTAINQTTGAAANGIQSLANQNAALLQKLQKAERDIRDLNARIGTVNLNTIGH